MAGILNEPEIFQGAITIICCLHAGKWWSLFLNLCECHTGTWRTETLERKLVYCLCEQFFLMSLKVDDVPKFDTTCTNYRSYTNQPIAWLQHNSRPIFIPSNSRPRRRRPIPGTWRKIAERCFPPSLTISLHSDKQSRLEEDVASLWRDSARSASKIHDFRQAILRVQCIIVPQWRNS